MNRYVFGLEDTDEFFEEEDKEKSMADKIKPNTTVIANGDANLKLPNGILTAELKKTDELKSTANGTNEKEIEAENKSLSSQRNDQILEILQNIIPADYQNDSKNDGKEKEQEIIENDVSIPFLNSSSDSDGEVTDPDANESQSKIKGAPQTLSNTLKQTKLSEFQANSPFEDANDQKQIEENFKLILKIQNYFGNRFTVLQILSTIHANAGDIQKAVIELAEKGPAGDFTDIFNPGKVRGTPTLIRMYFSGEFE